MYIKKVACKILSCDILYSENNLSFFLANLSIQPSLPLSYQTAQKYRYYFFLRCLIEPCQVTLTQLPVEQKRNWPEVIFLCLEHKRAGEHARLGLSANHSQNLGFFPAAFSLPSLLSRKHTHHVTLGGVFAKFMFCFVLFIFKDASVTEDATECTSAGQAV